MYYQFDYDSEPEWFDEKPQEDCEERRHRKTDEDEWQRLEDELKVNPHLFNHPSLPF
jgi:hypothetical protein